MSKPVLPIRTDRLLLRPHRATDHGWLLDLYGRADVARFLLDEPWTAELATRRLAERVDRAGLGEPAGALALVVEHDGAPVGDVALWLTDRERGVAEIGWVLHPEAGGRGLATEAVRAVLDRAFAHHGLHRVVAQMDARNTASDRLAERLGMQREAHLRQDWWCKGEWTDTLVYALLATDPAARRAPPGR